MSERINGEEIKWNTDIEYAYADSGKDKATVFETFVKRKGKLFVITVYPIALIDKISREWDYRIATVTKNGEIIDEYDAGAEHGTHFASAEEAKTASIRMLRDMLEVH